MAADEQFRCARPNAVRRDIQRLAAKPHATVANLHRQHDRFPDEAVHERGGRIVIDLAGRADLLDAALVHHHHPVCDFERLFLIVGDEDRGHVDFGMQRAQPLPQFLAHLGVERTERLVQKQDARLDRQRPRQRNALALTARQLARVAVGEPVELHQIQQFLDARADTRLVLAHRARLHAQAESDVFKHRHMAEQRIVLEHESDMALAGSAGERILAVERNLAGVGPIQPGDDAQQRGLARTRRPEQRQQFAIGDLQIDAVERGKCAESLDDIFDFNRHSGVALRPAAVRGWSSPPA